MEVEVGHHVSHGQHQPVQALVAVQTPSPAILQPLPLQQGDMSEQGCPGPRGPVLPTRSPRSLSRRGSSQAGTRVSNETRPQRGGREPCPVEGPRRQLRAQADTPRPPEQAGAASARLSHAHRTPRRRGRRALTYLHGVIGQQGPEEQGDCVSVADRTQPKKGGRRRESEAAQPGRGGLPGPHREWRPEVVGPSGPGC